MIKNKSKILRLAISIVLGGALGNFIDRLLYGKVTDFLDFYIFGYDYPVFNVADICVNIGTILLAIYIIFIYKEPNNEEAEESNEPLSSETGDGLNE